METAPETIPATPNPPPAPVVVVPTAALVVEADSLKTPLTPNAPQPSQFPLWMKCLSILIGLAIVAATTVALYSLSVVKQAAQSAAEAFHPQTKYITVLSGAIGELNNTPKLVVLTASLNASVTQESITTLFGVSVGSAKAEVTAPAKVEYILKLQDLKMDDIYYDELGKRMVVTIPHPMLDTDIIQIESDPAKIQVRTELGWSPLSIFKGGAVREEAMKHLRQSAIELGHHELLRERADKNAKDIVGDLMGKVKDAMKQDGVRLDVEFKKP